MIGSWSFGGDLNPPNARHPVEGMILAAVQGDTSTC
jgi:hypothetical protein